MSFIANGQPPAQSQTDVLMKSTKNCSAIISRDMRMSEAQETPRLLQTNNEPAPFDSLNTNPSLPAKMGPPRDKDVSAELKSDSELKATDTLGSNAPTNFGVLTATGATNGASDLYWHKLRTLLEDAQCFSKSLLPDASLTPIENLGSRGEFALMMQGRSPTECEARLANLPSSQSLEYRNVLDSCAAGSFTDYGVETPQVSWVVDRLFPLKDTSPCENSVAALEDWTRVRVFEAEVVCLPVQSIDILLAARKVMRNFRSRIDKCVRIIASMEGRGRRKAQSALDKLKAALEKAELQALAEISRVQKSSIREPGRERQTDEGETNSGAPSNSGTPSSTKRIALEAKRKKELAQQSAQASFMLRFVQGKSAGLSVSKAEEDYSDVHSGNFNDGYTTEKPANDDISRRQKGYFAASVADDRDVMSVSWWLRSCMSAIPFKELDEVWNQNSESKPTIDIRFLKSHLDICEERRIAAQYAVRSVLLGYRRGRKEHIGDRNPCFVQKRSDCRSKCEEKVVKLLQFDENHRPAYYGTWSRKSATVNGRRPFNKDCTMDYEYDSDEDWDEDEDGENLSDPEADDERAAEDAELRKLYGSDESDDEDYEETLDRDDGVDELDEGCEGGMETNEGCMMDDGVDALCHSQESAAEGVGVRKKIDFSHADFDETKTVNCVANPSVESNCKMVLNQGEGSKVKEFRIGSKRSGKRRKLRATQSVVIEGPCFGTGEKTVCPPLDQYPVTSHENDRIEMFNPFIMDPCALTSEHLKGRSAGTKSSRVTMDESARQELALAVENGSKNSHNRDRIVTEFCQAREARGCGIPSKSEIVRTINEMATFGKREGDTKPCWHLNSPVTSLVPPSSINKNVD